MRQITTNKNYMSKIRKMQRGQTGILCALLMVVGSMTGYAQSNCFEYDDDDNGETIITGLTENGLAASSLTIPATVTTVRSGAFSSTSAHVSALIIADGGNPVFEAELFGERENPLGDIQILGSSMTVANIRALLKSLVARDALSTIYIEGYSGAWIDIPATEEQISTDNATLLGVLTEDVRVTLPASLVSDQQFGAAKVYGRFEITKEAVTFCGNATFQDIDNGSNMLFYVAEQYCTDEDNSHYIYIKRVNYVAKGKGVLIHNGTNTSDDADLPRYDESIPQEEQDLYDNNMLVGVTEPTEIAATEGDYTNYIVVNELVNEAYKATFYPTSGGTIGANKAYLRVPTSLISTSPASANERLIIGYPEETGIRLTPAPTQCEGKWYDLHGRQLSGKPTTKGLYINNGKKYLIK